MFVEQTSTLVYSVCFRVDVKGVAMEGKGLYFIFKFKVLLYENSCENSDIIIFVN